MTEIHIVVDAQGLPIRLGLTAGQTHDGQIADTLLDHLGPRTIVLADKAYDTDRIRELIQDQGATPNIPPKSNRRWKPCFSKRLYRERNLIERFFSKLKHFRRVATRYDKLATNFLAMVQLASMRLWLGAYESTALDQRSRKVRAICSCSGLSRYWSAVRSWVWMKTSAGTPGTR
jgi:transposase